MKRLRKKTRSYSEASKELKKKNEYINITLNNIEKEHICCAIGDKKHQEGVDRKKEWIKNKLKDGHVFRKLNARGKIFIEYEPIETACLKGGQAFLLRVQ